MSNDPKSATEPACYHGQHGPCERCAAMFRADLLVDHAGRAAFRAYNRSRGGLTHDGKPIPAWEDLTEPIREAWRASAMAARAVEI